LYDLNQVKGIWTVSLTSDEYPIDVPKWETQKTGYDYYMSMLKEADQIRNGSIKMIMALATADQTRLWESIENSILI
jgi:hypothetical protein